jgi:hypothetical protein
LAAHLVLEQKARLAGVDEAAAYRELVAEEKQAADARAAASRVQVTVISDAELKSLRSVRKP